MASDEIPESARSPSTHSASSAAEADQVLRDRIRTDQDRFTRYNAAVALGRRGDPAAESTLREMLSTADLDKVAQVDGETQRQNYPRRPPAQHRDDPARGPRRPPLPSLDSSLRSSPAPPRSKSKLDEVRRRRCSRSARLPRPRAGRPGNGDGGLNAAAFAQAPAVKKFKAAIVQVSSRTVVVLPRKVLQYLPVGTSDPPVASRPLLLPSAHRLLPGHRAAGDDQLVVIGAAPPAA